MKGHLKGCPARAIAFVSIVVFCALPVVSGAADRASVRPVPPARVGSSSTVLEAYGDSLTAGFLDETNVAHAPPLKVVSKIVSDLAYYLLTGKRDQLGQYIHPELAWPQKLADILSRGGAPLKVANLAVSGALVTDLTGQVKNAPATSSPALAFFFIGHNNVCNNQGTPEAIAQAFKTEYSKALAEWDSRHVSSTAFLIPIGAIDRVYETLKDFVWYSNGKGRYTCWDSWEKFFPYCPSYAQLLHQNKLSDYLVPRLRAIRQAVADVASNFKETRRGNKVVYLEQALDKTFLPNYFAIDCYHLSTAGQTELAKNLYDNFLKLRP